MKSILENVLIDGYVYLYKALQEIGQGGGAGSWTTTTTGYFTISSGSIGGYTPSYVSPNNDDEEEYLITPDFSIKKSEVETLLEEGYNKILLEDLKDRLFVIRL